MTKVDMKYTSLFCRLRYVEATTDFFVKKYSDNFKVEIEAEKQEINYRKNTKTHFKPPTHLLEHKDFVVLECVDNLLKKGYSREDLEIIGNENKLEIPDIIVKNQKGKRFLAIECKRWGHEFEAELRDFKAGYGVLHEFVKKYELIPYLCLYSSRLDGGLLEWKYVLTETSNVHNAKNLYYSGLFEEDITVYNVKPRVSLQERRAFHAKINNELTKYPDIQDFKINEGILIKYLGNKQHVKIPHVIISVNTGAFWDRNNLISVEIPEGVERIGGDAFCYCNNLKRVNIPVSVKYIGNDPFAGCQYVEIKNESPYFILEDGVLYNKDKTLIIHYPINKQESEFTIPEGVEFINKHAFYKCNSLRKLTIPTSVKWIENNIFAGCKNVEVNNNSPYFTFEGGVHYNKEKTQVYSVYDHNLENLILPETVATIGKNSFFDCTNLKHLVIPKNVTRIGYNPFIGCNSIKLESYSSNYSIENGILLNQDKTKLKYCPNTSVDNTIKIPSFVQIIGRNAFSFCENLVHLEIPSSIERIERGAFSGCVNLEEIYIPESVQSIEKWCFSYCKNLKNIQIPKKTRLGEYMFSETPVNVEYY